MIVKDIGRSMGAHLCYARERTGAQRASTPPSMGTRMESLHDALKCSVFASGGATHLMSLNRGSDARYRAERSKERDMQITHRGFMS